MRIREEGPNEGKSTQKGRCPPPPGAVLGSGDTGRSTMTDTSWYAGQEGRAEGGDRVSHLGARQGGLPGGDGHRRREGHGQEGKRSRLGGSTLKALKWRKGAREHGVVGRQGDGRLAGSRGRIEGEETERGREGGPWKAPSQPGQRSPQRKSSARRVHAPWAQSHWSLGFPITERNVQSRPFGVEVQEYSQT